MSFFGLVRREMYGSLNRLIVISALGGISTAAILTAINSGAQGCRQGERQSLVGNALRCGIISFR